MLCEENLCFCVLLPLKRKKRQPAEWAVSVRANLSIWPVKIHFAYFLCVVTHSCAYSAKSTILSFVFREFSVYPSGGSWPPLSTARLKTSLKMIKVPITPKIVVHLVKSLY